MSLRNLNRREWYKAPGWGIANGVALSVVMVTMASHRRSDHVRDH